MRRRNFKICFLICFFIPLSIPITPSNAAVPPSIFVPPPREEVLWATGGETGPINLNPWLIDPEPWAPLMFETLYAFNTKTNESIPVIGLGDPFTAWSVDGLNITVNLNPNAKWSDGRIINATDVVMSYKLAEKQDKFSSELPTRFKDYIIVDNDTVVFQLHPNASYSRMALRLLSSDVPILPWYGVYEQINETYADPIDGSLATFENRWWNLPEELRVCSGPYAFVYLNPQLTESIYQRRDDWWGNTSTYSLYPDLPNWNKGGHPKYVGHRHLILNEDKNESLINGDVDLHSGPIKDIWTIWENPINDFSTHIQSYYEQQSPYYPPLGHTICVGFNQMHENQPGHVAGDNVLEEIWFREAMARVIDYNAIPGPVSGGYWKRAMPGFLDDVAHFYYWNDSINTQYRRDYDIAEANNIMMTHGCYRDINYWKWIGNDTRIDGGDIGNAWTMICPLGWEDVSTFTQLVCQDFKNWGIEVNVEYIDVDGPGMLEWNRRIVDKEYDLMIDCGGASNLLEPMLFYKPFQDKPSWHNNVTGWHNQTWLDIYRSLETTIDPGEFEYKLDLLQEILAREVPSIPCFIAPIWYTFSDYYWDGWVSVYNNYQQPLTIGINDQFVMKQRMVLNLINNDNISPSWEEEPTDQKIKYGELFTYDVDAIDNSGTVNYMINDRVNFIIHDTTGVITNKTVLEPGTYILNITAYDPSGNYIDSIIKITVSEDAIPGYDLVVLIAFMVSSTIAIGLYKKKKLNHN